MARKAKEEVSAVTETELDNTIQESNDEVTQEDTIEDKAREMGWKPLEEFDGPKENWKGPGAYVKDSELFASLNAQGKKLKDLELVINDLKGFMTKSEEIGYKRAEAELKAKREHAINTYDKELLEKVDDSLIELKTQQAAKVIQASSNQPAKHEDVLKFERDNRDWYNLDTPENMVMKQKADLLSAALLQADPKLSAEEHLSLVKADIRKLYPERFVNPRKSEPSAVGTSNGSKTSAGIDTRSLSPDVLASIKRCVGIGRVFPDMETAIKKYKEYGVIK